ERTVRRQRETAACRARAQRPAVLGDDDPLLQRVEGALHGFARMLDVDLDAAHRKADRLEQVERRADDEVRLLALDLEEGADQGLERELVRPRDARGDERRREQQRAFQLQRPWPRQGTNFWIRRPLIVSPV